MLSRVYAATTVGLDAILIDVEVDVANRGLPSFTIVGLPNKSVDEAKERVRTAITNTSFEMPDSRITVNLAPADIPKVGAGFDLPIALGILAALGVVDPTQFGSSIIVGELSLEGYVRPIEGALSIAIMAHERGMSQIFVPAANAHEASLVDGVDIYPVNSLAELVLHLNNQQLIQLHTESQVTSEAPHYIYDFADVRGQYQARRALEIAAAGFHNIHLKGSPGAGKTLLSKAFVSILPPMTNEEVIEVTRIYSVAGLTQNGSIIRTRPFRAPHHTTSRSGLIGGGTHPSPGEISLAHRGVLFMDEFAEFPRHIIESLRQPIEDGQVVVSRAMGSLRFPSRFILVAASNPCPCGYMGHPQKQCRCMPGMILQYRKRISGPLLDRIDLHIDVPPVAEQDLVAQMPQSESSSVIRTRVEYAHQRQVRRFGNTHIHSNAEMKPVDIRRLCQVSPAAMDLLKNAITKLSLSARSYYRVIKVGQTIADLGDSSQIEAAHIAEALQYRAKEE